MWCGMSISVVNKAVQDYDSYSICIDYFKLLWLQYASERILNHLITIDYDTLWLWLQYDMAVIFNHIIIWQNFCFNVHFGSHGLWTGLVVGSAGLSRIACSPVNIENILRICVWLCPLKQLGSNFNNYIIGYGNWW